MSRVPARHPGTPSRRPLRLLALVLPALLALSCFEQPVTESLEIRFLPGDAVAIRVRVKLADPAQFKDSSPARERIESARRDLLEGKDPWTRRLEPLEPVAERITWDRKEGSLCRVDHRAILEEGESLRHFFSDSLVRATVIRKGEESEFSLAVEPGSRATRAQQDRLRGDMERWSAAVSRYLQEGERLLDYLEEHPDRARACFGQIFRDILPDDTRAGLENLSPGDTGVVEPFQKAMEEVLELFSVPEDAALSLEELSRLVHDPFPAPLVVRVPGKILEVEGFEEGGEGVLRVPGLSLWDALLQSRDRWITPNPVIIYYEHLKDGKRILDLDALLARPRSAARAPTPGEVQSALEGPLRPAPLYRVRWSLHGLPEPEESEGEIWDDPLLR